MGVIGAAQAGNKGLTYRESGGTFDKYAGERQIEQFTDPLQKGPLGIIELNDVIGLSARRYALVAVPHNQIVYKSLLRTDTVRPLIADQRDGLEQMRGGPEFAADALDVDVERFAAKFIESDPPDLLDELISIDDVR